MATEPLKTVITHGTKLSVAVAGPQGPAGPQGVAGATVEPLLLSAEPINGDLGVQGVFGLASGPDFGPSLDTFPTLYRVGTSGTKPQYLDTQVNPQDKVRLFWQTQEGGKWILAYNDVPNSLAGQFTSTANVATPDLVPTGLWDATTNPNAWKPGEGAYGTPVVVLSTAAEEVGQFAYLSISGDTDRAWVSLQVSPVFWLELPKQFSVDPLPSTVVIRDINGRVWSESLIVKDINGFHADFYGDEILDANYAYALARATGTLGILRNFANATAANAVVAVGDVWWDTTLNKARTRLA